MSTTAVMGALITGMFAAIVALITQRGQSKAAIAAAQAAENKTKIDANKVTVDNLLSYAETMRADLTRKDAEIARLQARLDEIEDERRNKTTKRSPRNAE